MFFVILNIYRKKLIIGDVTFLINQLKKNSRTNKIVKGKSYRRIQFVYICIVVRTPNNKLNILIFFLNQFLILLIKKP